jgi:hypothetical protein
MLDQEQGDNMEEDMDLVIDSVMVQRIIGQVHMVKILETRLGNLLVGLGNME